MDKLNSVAPSIGTWITIGNNTIAEILSNAGYDWIVVDLEHSSISIDQTSDLIRIIGSAGVVPLVRLTSNDSNQIKRVMDAGSHGIIVPMVKSFDDVDLAVQSARYPPNGKRGFGLSRAQSFGSGFMEYLEWEKENVIVIIQIEHIDAVDNIESIFSHSMLDGYIIGPYDLTGSMGIPGEFNHPDYLNAVEKIRYYGDKYNIPSGIHLVEPDGDLLKVKVEEGYDFIAYSVDIRMLDVAGKNGLEALKEG